MIFGSVSWRQTWPNHDNLRRLTVDSRNSRSPARIMTCCKTYSFVLWSLLICKCESKWSTYSVVVKSMDFQFGTLWVRFPGRPPAHQAVHRSYFDKLVVNADSWCMTTVRHCECKCTQLYDGRKCGLCSR